MAKQEDVSGTNIADNTTANITVSDGEAAQAQKDGALEDVKDTAKAARHALTDGNLPGEPSRHPYNGWDEIMPWADLINLGVDEFENRVAKHPEGFDPIPDAKVYGLLALERNGQNRTPYVKAMMKRLHLKADELPGGGPDYTNDVTNITKLG